MRIFEIIHVILVFALFIAVPIAGSSRPRGQPFSLSTALKQSAIAAAVMLVLLVCNCVLARLASRGVRRRSSDHHAA
jgi:hypothetical protein